MDESLYAGREQSYVKHLILQRYLLRFAMIIGQHWNSITYIDCFSGPWQSRSDQLVDTSFDIAISQLRSAREKLATLGKDLKLRAFFIEDGASPFQALESYVAEIKDVEIEIKNDELENSISNIVRFVSKDPQTFPFVFVDPKGWTGYSLETIRPLLRLSPCEVLINFMTQHIVRFITNEASASSFEKLFGNPGVSAELKGFSREDRVDRCVDKYLEVVTREGGFSHTSVAGVLNPNKNRRQFDLLYLSRNAKGLDVFKGAEKKSMEDMESLRAKVESASREKRTRQQELFGADDAPPSPYYNSLRERYLSRAKLALGSVEQMFS